MRKSKPLRKKSVRTVEVKFNAQMTVEQTIILTDKKITISELERGLNTGKYSTSIKEKGCVVVTATGRVIGKVGKFVDTYDEEYIDFSVEHDDEDAGVRHKAGGKIRPL